MQIQTRKRAGEVWPRGEVPERGEERDTPGPAEIIDVRPLDGYL